MCMSSRAFVMNSRVQTPGPLGSTLETSAVIWLFQQFVSRLPVSVGLLVHTYGMSKLSDV